MNSLDEEKMEDSNLFVPHPSDLRYFSVILERGPNKCQPHTERGAGTGPGCENVHVHPQQEHTQAPLWASLGTGGPILTDELCLKTPAPNSAVNSDIKSDVVIQ